MPHNSPEPIDLTAIFGRFAGQEIIFTKTPRMPAEPAKDQNPVLEDLLRTAESHDLHLCLLWPGIVGTADSRADRVNVYVEKGRDGKYRIQPHFDIG